MAYSYVNYNGDGTTTDFALPFPYLDKLDIHGYINGAEVALTWPSDSIVRFSPAPLSGKIVKIQRLTNKDGSPVDFNDGSNLLEADLDRLALFALYVAQEEDDVRADVAANAALVQNVADSLDGLSPVNLPPLMLEFLTNSTQEGAAADLGLGDQATPTKGAGMVGFTPALGYPDGSEGAWLNKLCARSPQEILQGVNPTAWQYDVGDVRRYGAKIDGTTNDAAAWQAAFDLMVNHGGITYAPPGDTLVNAQLVISLLRAVPTYSPGSWKVSAFGTNMIAGPAINADLGVNDGYVIKLTQAGGRSKRNKIEGLRFDHYNNVKVAGGIKVLFGAHTVLENLTFNYGNTRSGYSSILLGPRDLGNPDTNTFWTTIRDCGFSLDAGTQPSASITLLGEANATVIEDCQFESTSRAISMVTDGVGVGVANAVLVQGNTFENVGIAVAVLARHAGVGGFWPTGLRLFHNRAETTGTFLDMNVLGSVGAATNHSSPPVLFGNYYTAGSVTTIVNNPFNAYVNLMDTSYYGPVTDVKEVLNGSSILRMNGNLDLGNQSGNTGYAGGHLVIGGYHVWINPANGKLMKKSGAPTSDTDGIVVGNET